MLRLPNQHDAKFYRLEFLNHVNIYELHFTSELATGNVIWGKIVQFSNQELTLREKTPRILCTDQRNSKTSFNKTYSLRYIWSMPFLSEFHRKTSQKYISFFSKQTLTRYNKRSKVPFLLEAGLQVLLFFVLSRFYNAGRFTSQVRSLINITDANIYDAISTSVPEKSRMRRSPRSELISHCISV